MGFLPPYDVLEKSWSLTLEVLEAYSNSNNPIKAYEHVLDYMCNNKDDIKYLQTYIKCLKFCADHDNTIKGGD